MFDPESASRNRVARMLRRRGFTAIRATGDPVTALEILRCGRVDVLVITHELPFIRFLRATPSLAASQVPLVMISAHTRRSDLREALDAGIDEMVVAPAEAEVLARAVERAHRGPRRYVASEAYTGPDRRRTEAADEDLGNPEAAASEAGTEIHLTQAEIDALLRR